MPTESKYPRTVGEPLEVAMWTPDGETFKEKKAEVAKRRKDKEVREAEVSEDEVRPKLAVFAAHGMGQQIPFQTMDSIAGGLLKAAEAPPNTEIRTRTIKLVSPTGDPEKDVITQRIELIAVKDPKNPGGEPVDIHIYEGYWAPLTEGKVTARDVISFFIDAAWNGIRKGRKPFQRWLFGDTREPKQASGTVLSLGVALLAFLTLILFNAVIAAVVMGHYLKGAGTAIGTAWPSLNLIGALTWVIGGFCAVAVIYILLLLISNWRKPSRSPGSNKLWVAYNAFLWKLFFFFLVATIATGLGILVLVTWERFSFASFEKWVWAWKLNEGTAWWPVIWLTLFAISGIVRRFLVQYVGDVTAYISAYRLDRFVEIRAQIRQCVFTIARAVYSDSSYERIGIIGHSLGSVVVYDALNRLLLDDELNGSTLNVRGRTKVLVTFGCPLDKAAYMFSLRDSKTSENREALAASLQPLIRDYAFRTMDWVNVYSPHDIFAAPLDFYDFPLTPEEESKKVINQKDPDAQVPLLAHNEYWEGTMIYEELYRRL